MEYQARIEKTQQIMAGDRKGQSKKILTIWLIDAGSIIEAEKKAGLFVENNLIHGQLLGVDQAAPVSEVKIIPDAESLLFELEANNIDEITVPGGLGEKSETYTRKAVEASVYATISEVTHEYNFWNGVHQRRVIS